MNIDEIVKEKNLVVKAISIIVYCGYFCSMVMVSLFMMEHMINTVGATLQQAVVSVVFVIFAVHEFWQLEPLQIKLNKPIKLSWGKNE